MQHVRAALLICGIIYLLYDIVILGVYINILWLICNRYVACQAAYIKYGRHGQTLVIYCSVWKTANEVGAYRNS